MLLTLKEKYRYNFEDYRQSKKLFKKILKKFKENYGKAIIIESLKLLCNEFQINEKLLRKISFFRYYKSV